MLWCGVAGSPEVLPRATKCDLVPEPPRILATSAVTGAGIAELRSVLIEKARQRKQPALAPSLSRCRHHVDTCLQQLAQARNLVDVGEPDELVALEIRESLEQLGEIVGAVYSDDLLDRIFSRFCIGK